MSATDKAENAIDDTAGKAREALGGIAGDKDTENEGKLDPAGADVKDAGEKVKDAVEN